MPTNVIVGPVQTVVEKVKVLARTALRGQLISARLARIASLNNDIADLNSHITAENKEIARANYALSIVDPKNPDAADLTKEASDRVDTANKAILGYNNDIVTVQKLVDEQNAGIAKIESGETKVSSEELACLTDKMLVAYAKEQVASL